MPSGNVLSQHDTAHLSPRAWNFLNEKKWPSETFSPTGRRYFTDHFSAKMKIFHRGLFEKNSKIQNGRHFYHTLYRKSWLKGYNSYFWKYFNSKWKIVTYFISLSKNYYLFLYHSFKTQTRMNHCLFVWNTKKIEENTKKL